MTDIVIDRSRYRGRHDRNLPARLPLHSCDGHPAGEHLFHLDQHVTAVSRAVLRDARRANGLAQLVGLEDLGRELHAGGQDVLDGAAPAAVVGGRRGPLESQAKRPQK